MLWVVVAVLQRQVKPDQDLQIKAVEVEHNKKNDTYQPNHALTKFHESSCSPFTNRQNHVSAYVSNHCYYRCNATCSRRAGEILREFHPRPDCTE